MSRRMAHAFDGGCGFETGSNEGIAGMEWGERELRDKKKAPAVPLIGRDSMKRRAAGAIRLALRPSGSFLLHRQRHRGGCRGGAAGACHCDDITPGGCSGAALCGHAR
jgi:hypothetical protein